MKQSVQLIIDALTKLASSLGQTVQYLWPQFLRYIVADGIAWMLAGFVLFGLVYVYWFKIYPKIEDDDAKIAGAVGGTIGGVIAVIFAIVLVFGNIAQIVSPAGYSVSQILKGEKP